MTALIQRVKSAALTVSGKFISGCGAGYFVLLGVRRGDTENDAVLLASKTAKLRVCEDESGKMNRSPVDTGGEILVEPNFTLCADASHGNRPDFFNAEEPEKAKALYERYLEALASHGITVKGGVFGTDMQTVLSLDGPVTLILDTREFASR